MNTRPIKRWTLRELLNGSDRISRDLVDHFTEDYVPRIKEAVDYLEPNSRSTPSTDPTIVDMVKRVEKANAYSSELVDQLVEIVSAIQAHAEQEVG